MLLRLGVSVLLLVGLAKQGGASSGRDWSYEGATGPSSWGNIAEACNGRRQSPVNIVTEKAEDEEDWPKLELKNYDQMPKTVRVKNNGHTAQVEMDAALAPRIDKGGLPGEYVFVQLHFHWGVDSTSGSEHTINSVKYPMEMHLVHYKTTHGSVTAAVKKPDGLAVLGIMFETSQLDNPAFTPLVLALGKINTTNPMVEVPARYSLRAYLPRSLSRFYRYNGSLTTPTCNEAVTWTVFEEAVPISELQMRAFRRLKNHEGHDLVNNFRPIQDLNERKVRKSWSDDTDLSHASTVRGLHRAVYVLPCVALVLVSS